MDIRKESIQTKVIHRKGNGHSQMGYKTYTCVDTCIGKSMGVRANNIPHIVLIMSHSPRHKQLIISKPA